MLKVIAIGLIALGLASHEYFVTITEMEYNEANSSMEVSIKFTGHDLEYALEQRGVPHLYLGTDKEHEEANDYLLSYLHKGFAVSVNGQPVEFELIGKEVNNEDFIYVYLEAKQAPEPGSLVVKNTLLTEQFEQQANIIHFSKGDNTTSFTLTKDHPEETHEIEK